MPRFATVVTRDISDFGVYLECRAADAIPLYRLVYLQIERDGRDVSQLPPALRDGRVLSAGLPRRPGGALDRHALGLRLAPARRTPGRPGPCGLATRARSPDTGPRGWRIMPPPAMPAPQPLPSWLTPDRLARWQRAISVAPRPRRHGGARPVHGGPPAPVPRGQADDVRAAVARAREAQRSWAATPPRQRARVLLAFHDLVLAGRDEAMDLVQLEVGKARLDAFEEVADSANVARHYGIHAPSLLADRRRKGALPLCHGGDVSAGGHAA